MHKQVTVILIVCDTYHTVLAAATTLAAYSASTTAQLLYKWACLLHNLLHISHMARTAVEIYPWRVLCMYQLLCCHCKQGCVAAHQLCCQWHVAQLKGIIAGSDAPGGGGWVVRVAGHTDKLYRRNKLCN